MKSAFVLVIALALSLSSATPIRAQDDLTTKAQSERELVVYGTALAGHFEKFSEPFRQRFPFIKTQYSRTTGEALTSKI